MSRRSYGSKPTIAFWMLVAIADGAMLIAAVGPAVTVSVLAGIGLVISGVVVARRSNRPRVLDQVRALVQPRPARPRRVEQPRLVTGRRPGTLPRLVSQGGVTTTEVVARRRA